MKKIFISSTFTDMHEERNLIQNIVQPAINQKLKNQGEYVSFTDLRWGIDTETDSTEYRILNACFDQIDSCKPYFIVFVGGRYGWVPKVEMIEPFRNRLRNIDIVNKSITELEIRYALKLNANDLSHCFFYFREDAKYENANVKKNILLLQEHLAKIAPSQIRYYKSIIDNSTQKNLAHSLITDIYELLNTKKTLNWQERINNQINVLFDNVLPGITSQWLDNLSKGTIDLAVLLYPECKVKESAIINFYNYIKSKKKANLIDKLLRRQVKQIHSLYVNIGITKEISTTSELQKYLIYKLSEILGNESIKMENSSDITLKHNLNYLLNKYAETGNEIYIIISEYDKLINSENISWFPDYICNIKWIVSVTRQDIAELLPSLKHHKCIYGHSHIGDIPIEQQITAYERLSGKSIPMNVKMAIKNVPFINNYIVLEMIFNCLAHFDAKDLPEGNTKDIPLYMEGFINEIPNESQGIKAAIRYFLYFDFQKFNIELCEFIFISMTFFKKGLAIVDMEKIANRMNISWSELDIIWILNYEAFLLKQYEDGRYAISSDFVTTSLAAIYERKFKFEYSYVIFDYLTTLSGEDSIKIDNYWNICFLTNHFKEYWSFLDSLYQKRIDNTNLKAAFLPIFSSSETVAWFMNSLKKQTSKLYSTAMVCNLISIVACAFSDHHSKFIEEFIEATKSVRNEKGDLTMEFRQHYVLALNKFTVNDFNAYIEHLNICIQLSKKQYNVCPSKLELLTEDGKFFLGSIDSVLEQEFHFSFVEEIAALMSKYSDLPTKYQDSLIAEQYAETTNKIRTQLSKISYILPENILNNNAGSCIKRQKPSLLRGKAVELSKQSDKHLDKKIKKSLINQSISLFNKIFSIAENDLVGNFKDAQKTLEYESAVYDECHRDLAITYEKLSDLQEGSEKFDSLQKAYEQIAIYCKKHETKQTQQDILRITDELIPLALQFADEDKSFNYCVCRYITFVQTCPGTNNLEFEERLYAEFTEERIYNDIKDITFRNSVLRTKWIEECKNQINTFQSIKRQDALEWMVSCLIKSYSYYIHELNLHEYISEHINIIGAAIQNLKENVKVDTWKLIFEDLKKYLNVELSKDNILNILKILNIYSRNMLTNGNFDNSFNASQIVINFCKKNKQISSEEFVEIKMEAVKLYSSICLERNEIGEAWSYMKMAPAWYRS